ncbi:MAG: hypothetical protein KA945_11460, partial [Zoogloea sp.]|nr:hypothetical protein [Zoogloea sp.]
MKYNLRAAQLRRSKAGDSGGRNLRHGTRNRQSGKPLPGLLRADGQECGTCALFVLLFRGTGNT